MATSQKMLVDIDHEFEHIGTAERAEMVKAQNKEFETTLFGHQLNLTRIAALPPVEPDTPDAEERDRVTLYETTCVNTLLNALQVNRKVIAELEA